MTVLLATPTYGGRCAINYIRSAHNLVLAARDRGLSIEWQFSEQTMINRGRNTFASLVLENPDYTHLLFADDDIGFRPEAVFRMLDFGRPLVGCLCPARAYDAEALVNKPAGVPADKALQYVALEGLVSTEVEGRRAFQVNRGFVRCRYIGMGLTLIARTVFERIAERYPELIGPPDTIYRRRGVSARVLQCFETLRREDGAYVGEDLAFCQRWTEGCGGDVWACVDEEISHVGVAEFVGRAVDRLGAGF